MHIVFFFNDTATTEIYTLSLHDALPIFLYRSRRHLVARPGGGRHERCARQDRARPPPPRRPLPHEHGGLSGLTPGLVPRPRSFPEYRMPSPLLSRRLLLPSALGAGALAGLGPL